MTRLIPFWHFELVYNNITDMLQKEREIERERSRGRIAKREQPINQYLYMYMC